MKKIAIIFAYILLIAVSAQAQSGIDSVLATISRNNKTLKVNANYWEAQKDLFKTGLTLYDPTISYDYMRGSPSAIAGNQTDINVSQAFDFPTVYGKKRKLVEEQGKQADFSIAAQRQEILLDAKKICVELIYRNKLAKALGERKAKTEKYLKDFQTRLDKGQGNILDVNKAKLLLVEIAKDHEANRSAIIQLQHKLSELNGGQQVNLTDTIYPSFTAVPTFEALEGEIEKDDPVRKYLSQQTVIAQKQIEVTKGMALPKFEAGYHYQGILGQRFNGARIGMSIPLWENRNRVKTRQSELKVAETKLDEHRNEHYFDIKRKYERYLNLQGTVESYRKVLGSSNSLRLLDKALAYGEISTIQYFMEAGYLYSATDSYLKAEMEYHMSIAELYQYKL